MSALHILQDIADEKFKDCRFEKLPPTNNPEHIFPRLRLLNLFGEIGYDNNIEEIINEADPYLIRHGVFVKRPNGKILRGNDAFKLFKKGSAPKEAYEKDTTIVVNKIDDTEYRVINSTGERTVKLKLCMNEEDLQKIFSMACRFSPPGSLVEMQADSHCAGDIFVGMVMVFDDQRIPISLVSNDIGCGLTLVPITEIDGSQLHVDTIEDIQKFKMKGLVAARTSLKRGRVSETQTTICEYMYDASSFYEAGELATWLTDMKDVLFKVGLWREAQKDRSGPFMDLDEDQHTCLKYIGRYAQSLGSSGNHFLEVSEDDRGFIWAVVHSGSRRLGAMIYTAISNACRILNDGEEIATNELAALYNKAYRCLDKFARMNRCVCAIAVMKSLGLESNGTRLANTLRESWIFKDSARGDCSRKLIHGLTHNGIKTFVNHEKRLKVNILTKGAIAVSARASSSIVALKAGEGCVVFVLSDASCKWEESSCFHDYDMSTSEKDWEGDIILAGHGAGRKQSTTKTENEFRFNDLVKYFDDHEIIGNIAPGIIGDHPDGYKDASQIIKKLPIERSSATSRMKTMVSYKEGLPTKGPRMTKRLMGYVVPNWNSMTDAQKVSIDLNILRSEVCQEFFEMASRQVEEIMRGIESTG